MLALRLPPDVEERLEDVSQRTGRSRADVVIDALLAHLDDIEDVTAADAALSDIREGRASTVPLEQVERDLGLAG